VLRRTAFESYITSHSINTRHKVKLLQTCCILHNWILGFGVGEVVPTEVEWVTNPASSSFTGPPFNALQTQEVPTMASVRDAISDAMWDSRGLIGPSYAFHVLIKCNN
jgi:hypothetical protein